jgi:dethiobiotin synthetase
MIAGLPGLFVTGTDTGVGKTWVAAAVARALRAEGRRVGVLKPVATGVLREDGVTRSEDADILIEAVGGGVPIERVVPLAFEAPLAPPVAARLAGATLPHSQVREATRAALSWWRGQVDVVVVEGVGGLLCPLGEGSTVADLAVDLDYPLVMVARRGLGTLNHTLLTVEAALRRGLRVAGIVLNEVASAETGLAERTNAEELARRLPGIAVLAEVPFDPSKILVESVIGDVHWIIRANPPRLG